MNGNVALQDLEVQLAVREKRAGGKSPLESEVTVVAGDAAVPEFLAGMIEGNKSAISVKEDCTVFIDGGRRRRVIAILVAIDPVAGLLVPEDLAGFAIKAHGLERLVLGIHTGNENTVAQDDRCGRARAREIGGPSRGFFGPFCREALFRREAVEVRPAPL